MFHEAFYGRFTTRQILTLVALVGVAVLLSCSVEPNDPLPPTGPETRVLSFRDTASLPTDTVRWKRGEDSGVASLGPNLMDLAQKKASLTLSSPLAEGKVEFSLWTLGLRTAVLQATSDGAAGFRVTQIQPDTLAQKLIARCVGLNKLDSVKFPLDREGLIRSYAHELVEGTFGFGGFPASRPLGMDSARVVDASLIFFAAKHVPFRQGVGISFLGLDSAVVHARILGLILEKKISSTDSLALFPLPAVRVKISIQLARDTLVIGRDKMSVQGTVETDSSLGLDRVDVKVFDSAGSQVGSEKIVISAFAQPFGVFLWDLDQKISLLTTDSVRPGEYHLVVVAYGRGRKDSAMATCKFKIVPAPPVPDTMGPLIGRVAPLQKLVSVGHDTDSYLVRLTASDSSGVTQVWINDSLASFANGNWTRKVLLDTGAANPVHIKAIDSRRNESFDTLYITRQRLVIVSGPKVTFLGGSTDFKIPFEQSSVTLSWSIRDSVKFVSIDSQLVLAKNDTLFEIKLNLAPNGNPTLIQLVAMGTNSVGTESRVRVTRAKDTLAPVIAVDSASWKAIGVFQGDTLVVPPTATDFTLKWKIFDNHQVRAVTLDGDTLRGGSDSTYSWGVVKFPTGLKTVTVSAVDSTGNIQVGHAKVLRRDQVLLFCSADTIFTDSGVVKASTSTPGAILQYSTDDLNWKNLPDAGIRLTASAKITFRGRKEGYLDAMATKNYTVNITPPPEATIAVWNEFTWNDKLRVWK